MGGGCQACQLHSKHTTASWDIEVVVFKYWYVAHLYSAARHRLGALGGL